MSEFGLSPLKRLRQSGVTPAHSLGQNFLIDANILGVIERLAGLAANDIILEVGPGAGVLTGRLLERCGLVHAIEIDPRLTAMLKEEFAGRANFRLIESDALKLSFAGLDPPPSKFVANLPYSVAAPLVMKSLRELPGMKRWCLMLQKEIGDRLFARPGTAAYAGVSVMMQLLTEKIASRPLPETVFYPQPRVRSTLLAFRRRSGARYASSNFAAVKELVYACFSHRRKTLANSLAADAAGRRPPALAGQGPDEIKNIAERLLVRLGLDANARAAQLAPGQHERLAQLIIENVEGPESHTNGIGNAAQSPHEQPA